jgi:hypothetical protein
VQLLWLHAGGYALLRIAERTERELNVWNPRREGVYTGPAMSATGRTHRLALPRAALPPCACSLPFASCWAGLCPAVSFCAFLAACLSSVALPWGCHCQAGEGGKSRGEEGPVGVCVPRCFCRNASQQRSHWTADCTVAQRPTDRVYVCCCSRGFLKRCATPVNRRSLSLPRYLMFVPVFLRWRWECHGTTANWQWDWRSGRVRTSIALRTHTVVPPCVGIRICILQSN